MNPPQTATKKGRENDDSKTSEAGLRALRGAPYREAAVNDWIMDHSPWIQWIFPPKNGGFMQISLSKLDLWGYIYMCITGLTNHYYDTLI